MKLTCLILLLLVISPVFAQNPATGETGKNQPIFYDFQWKLTDISHARYYSVVEHTDSGWHRINYYIHGPSPEMDGWYEDSACTIANGKVTHLYSDKKIVSTGRYANNKKEGLWLSFHWNGVMKDSAAYTDGKPIGNCMAWYPNGIQSDSAIYQPDGSGVEVKWFDNGNASAAGKLTAGYKKTGKWQFFHDNGKVSDIEVYDNGILLNRKYFDETGKSMPDTTNNDRPSSFKGGNAEWQKYLGGHLYWPRDYHIGNADVAAVIISATIDENGNVKDAYVSTPFYPPFEKIALDVIRKSPKWLPAMNHNRRVRGNIHKPVIFRQPAN